jgi:hypothetical protein
MDLNKLNERSESANFKETIKPSSLNLYQKYKIVKFEIITTVYGKAALCELEDGSLWLPKRFTAWFEENLNEINSGEFTLMIKSFKVIKGKATPIIVFDKV